MTTTGQGRSRRRRQGVDGSVYPRGKKWAYVVDLGSDPLTGERRRDSRSGFETETAAWSALIDANQHLRSSTYVKNTPLTVSQFFDEWLDAMKMSIKPTTHSNYRSYAKYYVVPIIGNRKLQDITTETITRLYKHLLESGRKRGDSNQVMYEAWQRSIAIGQEASPRELADAANVTYSAGVRARQRFRAGRAPSVYAAGLDARSVQSIHIMLNRALADAVKWKYISDNPVTNAARVRRSRKGHIVWTPDELRQFLIEAKRERLYAMWLLFATTGIRRSEAAGARISYLNVDGRSITLWATRVVAAGLAQSSDGKSARSRRELALDRRTMDALIRHIANVRAESAAFGVDYKDHGLLFCWEDGRPLHPDTITEQFNRIVDRAKITHITLHDVRHTYATMSLRAGVNPKIVSTRLGHASVAFTLDTYTEDVPELHHAAAETVSNLFLGDESDAPDVDPPIDSASSSPTDT